MRSYSFGHHKSSVKWMSRTSWEGSFRKGPVKRQTVMVWVVPLPVTVTTRMIPFFVWNCYYKPSFATITRRGDNPSYGVHFSYMGFFIHLQRVLFRFFFWDFPFGTAFLFCRFFHVLFCKNDDKISQNPAGHAPF